MRRARRDFDEEDFERCRFNPRDPEITDFLDLGQTALEDEDLQPPWDSS
jgi:hypothetical protein